MKSRILAALLLLAPWLAAGEADPGKLLADLAVANEAKDASKIDELVKDIKDYAESTKDQATADVLAAELVKSLKVCKGNWGTIRGIVDAMGELRSKKSLSVLKRLGFRKDPAEGDAESVQVQAILALGKYRSARLLKGLEEQCRSRAVPVAKAAYTSFKSYGPAKGRIRKKAAEIIMKRMESERPNYGGGGSNVRVSAAQQERWNQLRESVVASMQAICHEPTINDVENWREWWRENKKNPRAWKDPKKKKSKQ